MDAEKRPPGGVDELLEHYRPKVSRRGADWRSTKDLTQFQPIVAPDALDQSDPALGIDLPDSPTPLAHSAELLDSPASVADGPVTDRSVVDSAFITLSNPPATDEAALDPFAHPSSACVTIAESPDFAAVVSSVAVAVLGQGGLLLALPRPEDEPATSLSPRARAVSRGARPDES